MQSIRNDLTEQNFGKAILLPLVFFFFFFDNSFSLVNRPGSSSNGCDIIINNPFSRFLPVHLTVAMPSTALVIIYYRWPTVLHNCSHHVFWYNPLEIFVRRNCSAQNVKYKINPFFQIGK